MDQHDPTGTHAAGDRGRSDSDDITRARKPLMPSTTEDWLFLLAGLALVGYGAYRLATTSPPSPLIGPGAIGLGMTLMPWRIVGLIGGVGLVVLGGWRLYEGYAIEQAGLVMLLGVIGIAERIRRA